MRVEFTFTNPDNPVRQTEATMAAAMVRMFMLVLNQAIAHDGLTRMVQEFTQHVQGAKVYGARPGNVPQTRKEYEAAVRSFAAGTFRGMGLGIDLQFDDVDFPPHLPHDAN